MAGDSWGSVEQLQAEGVLLVEDGNHGEYRPRREEFVTTGTAFVRAADIASGRVNFEQCEHINGVALARIRKGIGRPNDIILSHKGTVGKLALVPNDAPPFVCSPQTTFWRVLDETKLNRGYLYAFMRSRLFEAQLVSVQGETDMAPYVSLTAQRRLKIALPNEAQQKAVGELLGAIDEKIELNRRIAETREAMARALFRSWFVDFDPVSAKARRHSTGLPDDLAALFPDSFNEDGLPRGWERKPLKPNLARSIVRGISPSYADEGMPILNQRCIRDGRVELTKARYHDLTSKRLNEDRLLVSGDIVINSTGVGTLGRVAQIRQAPHALSADSHVTIVKPNRAAISPNLFGLALINQEPFIETLGRGSTGQTELSRESVGDLEIVMATEQLRQAFDDIVVPLREGADLVLEEAQTLRELRDTLLPKLISGEVRIAHAEKKVSAA